MAKVTDLVTLAKTSVASTDFLLISNSDTGGSKKLTVESMFPSVSTAGSSSETLYNSATLTNKNQIVFKGIKSGDTGLLTVATTSNNIVLTALEAGIDLSLCNNATSAFTSGVDFTGVVTGECPVSRGGTGLSTLAKGTILYASDTDTLTATAVPSNNADILVYNATTGIPVWTSIDAGDITANQVLDEAREWFKDSWNPEALSDVASAVVGSQNVPNNLRDITEDEFVNMVDNFIPVESSK